jgi:hypothetical protein
MAHELRDKETGVPILGTVDPAAAARDALRALADEKRNLAPDDHNWVVIIQYAISEVNAGHIMRLKTEGTPVPPPGVPVVNETMIADSMPTCLRCMQTYDIVADQPCPGMTFEQYIESLDPETRESVLDNLRAQAAGGAVHVTAPAIPEVGDRVVIMIEDEPAPEPSTIETPTAS